MWSEIFEIRAILPMKGEMQQDAAQAARKNLIYGVRPWNL